MKPIAFIKWLKQAKDRPAGFNRKNIKGTQE